MASTTGASAPTNPVVSSRCSSNEENTRKTAAELGAKITRGSLKPCEACAVAKAKRKAIPKHVDEPLDAKVRMYAHIQTFKIYQREILETKKVQQITWKLTINSFTKFFANLFDYCASFSHL